MYAFPDICRDEARRVARCMGVFRGVLQSSLKLKQKSKRGDAGGGHAGCTRGSSVPITLLARETSNLVPDPQQAKFLALGAQFVIIQGLCQQDLRFKTFYDLTGSSGRAGLAAVLLKQWSAVVSLESSVGNFDTAVMARRIAQRVQPLDALTKTSAWRIEHATFKSAEWIDGDVVFFDGTVFESLDEGVLCDYFQGRVRALQAGSFVVLFTRCADQLLIGDNFKLICSNTQEHIAADGRELRYFTSWLFKTSLHSNDHRVGIPDATSRAESGSIEG